MLTIQQFYLKNSCKREPAPERELEKTNSNKKLPFYLPSTSNVQPIPSFEKKELFSETEPDF